MNAAVRDAGRNFPHAREQHQMNLTQARIISAGYIMGRIIKNT